VLELIIIKNNFMKKNKNILGQHEFNNSYLIGLISDTHVPEARDSIWSEISNVFNEVQLILHAGDMHNLSVLEELEEIAPVVACRGNGDDGSSGRPLLPDHPHVSQNQIITINDMTIGLTHSFIHDERLGIKIDDQMIEKFGSIVDIVVAGDTHVPIIKKIYNDTMIINSGSALLPYNFNTQLGTVGFIHIKESKEVDLWIEMLHE